MVILATDILSAYLPPGSTGPQGVQGIQGISGVTPSFASQVQAEAGTDNTTVMSPLRTFQVLKSLTIDVQEFETAGGPFTWTKPTDAIYCEIIVVGGGQAGGVGVAAGMCVVAQTGSGGDAGGTALLSKVASALGATETVTVGAGGATSLASGGTSSFGTHASATGGGGGGAGSGTGAQNINGQLGFGGVSGEALSAASMGGSSFAGRGGRNSAAGVRGGGGGGGAGAASFGAGGAGYVRIVTYCA